MERYFYCVWLMNVWGWPPFFLLACAMKKKIWYVGLHAFPSSQPQDGAFPFFIFFARRLNKKWCENCLFLLLKYFFFYYRPPSNWVCAFGWRHHVGNRVKYGRSRSSMLPNFWTLNLHPALWIIYSRKCSGNSTFTSLFVFQWGKKDIENYSQLCILIVIVESVAIELFCITCR